jgi:hypothetical protein
MDIHNTYTKWDLCKEDLGFDDELYGYVSVYDLTTGGVPIDYFGQEMTLADDSLYVLSDGGEYHVISCRMVGWWGISCH